MLRLLERVYITDKSRYARPRLTRYDCILLFEGEPVIDDMNAALGQPNALAVWKSDRLPVDPYTFLEKVAQYEPRPNRDVLIFCDPETMASLVGHMIVGLYPRIDFLSYGQMFQHYANHAYTRALELPFCPMPEWKKCRGLAESSTFEHLYVAQSRQANRYYDKSKWIKRQNELFTLERLLHEWQSGLRIERIPILDKFIEEMMRQRVYVELPLGGEHFVTDPNAVISNREELLSLAERLGLQTKDYYRDPRLGINVRLLEWLSEGKHEWI